jgi:hypothetical protein
VRREGYPKISPCVYCVGGNTWEVRKVIWLELDGLVSSVEGRN